MSIVPSTPAIAHDFEKARRDRELRVQSKLRNRGGLFQATPQRDNLLQVLRGNATISPIKPFSHLEAPDTRTSSGARQSKPVEDDANPCLDLSSHTTAKPIKKPATKTATKKKPQSTAGSSRKAPVKRTTKVPKTLEGETKDTASVAAPPKGSKKATSKPSKSKIVLEEESVQPVAESSTRGGRTKAASKSRPAVEDEEPAPRRTSPRKKPEPKKAAKESKASAEEPKPKQPRGRAPKASTSGDSGPVVSTSKKRSRKQETSLETSVVKRRKVVDEDPPLPAKKTSTSRSTKATPVAKVSEGSKSRKPVPQAQESTDDALPRKRTRADAESGSTVPAKRSRRQEPPDPEANEKPVQPKPRIPPRRPVAAAPSTPPNKRKTSRIPPTVLRRFASAAENRVDDDDPDEIDFLG